MERTIQLNARYELAGINGTGLPAYVDCFLNRVPRELGRRFRKAVIVCPGGGYLELTEKETDMVAIRFQAYGFQSFVLHYSTGGKPYPAALLELAEAAAEVRRHADEWDIDPAGIFVCGFSAGGHLAASLAVHWDKPLFQSAYPGQEHRPNGTILCYPMISNEGYGRKWLEEPLGMGPDSPWRDWLSVEKHVSASTPPCFLWHNADDRDVPPTNSIAYLSALAEHGIPFEVHMFPTGGHALSLADETTASAESYIDAVNAQWSRLAIDWLQRM